MKLSLALTLFAAATCVACKKDPQPEGSNAASSRSATPAASTGNAAAPTPAAPAAPAAKATFAVPKLGLKLALPAETEISEQTATEFDLNPPDSACNISLSKVDLATTAVSYEQIIKDTEIAPPDDNGFVVKEWKTKTKAGNGYTLVYKHLTKKDDKAGKDKPASYVVRTRVVVGADTYDCDSRLDTTLDGTACVVKACTSLTKG